MVIGDWLRLSDYSTVIADYESRIAFGVSCPQNCGRSPLGLLPKTALTVPQGVQQHQALSDFQTELDLFADKRVGNQHRDRAVPATLSVDVVFTEAC